MFVPLLRAIRSDARPIVRNFTSGRPVFNTQRSSKLYSSAQEAIGDIQSGQTVMVGGFGLCGTPETLIRALSERPDVRDLNVVSNNMGTPGKGLGLLAETEKVKMAIGSYVGGNKAFSDQFIRGDVSVHLIPQGTLAEKIRAGGAGIPAFYTATGSGTAVESGELIMQYKKQTPEEIEKKVALQPLSYSKPLETREFDGRTYVMEKAIHADFALVHAWKVDEAGNAIFRRTARNFNDVMARNAKVTIVEAEEIVPVGEIDPDHVHLPSLFVNRIVKAVVPMSTEFVMLSKEDPNAKNTHEPKTSRDIIAKRAAQELQNGMYVNLGIGMPGLVPSWLPEGVNVMLHAENGLLGIGPYPSSEAEVDPDLINAGKESITFVPGATSFDASDSFGIVRGGHLDVTMLGALQVTCDGDLANFMIPGKFVKGMGGAMDLVSNPEHTRVIVLTEHVDKYGRPKVVKNTSLPLTGSRCVDLIVTDMAVFKIDRKKGGMTLIDLAPGVSEEQVRKNTDAPYEVALQKSM
ncbi:3-oxoacid CoA-transferase [Malassezia psittaci]|uniref:Succinyl-CoA:3-ketoacid-coenzyme A transferase n=1 Tax=Malassezia psittaci TaxID=1821823 RepID=A0AAF0F757_9BASI|nr:3-oxoacid CoA-transferase [Malassezia psittaci]